jgi:type II secretory pathway component GspD/PulD (secretin)
MGTAVLLYLAAQSGTAETVITAQDYAVDSDVALESAVREIKSVPEDTVNAVGDTVKFAADETVTAAKGVAAAFKSDPMEKIKKDAMLDIATAWDSSNDIVFRSYKISQSVSEELIAGADAPEGDVVNVTGAFYGIEFPKKSSAYLRPEFNRLFVRNTMSNIHSVEDVLAELHSVERELLGKQISIETKFVEINQSTLNDLGFKWDFMGKNGGDAKLFDDLFLPAGQGLFKDGLRTAAGALNAGTASDTLDFWKTTGWLQWNLVISALEQQDDADILSAPSIVTRDGSTASIIVGEERTVSSGFDVKNSESSLYIEHDLDIENFGVMLEVTPELRSDSLIDLELNPKVIDLIGYDNYLIHNDATVHAYQGIRNPSPYDQFDIPALTGSMPYYRLREMETQVTVADGSTVGMGGLIYDKLETYRDKVPVLGSIPYLGRLFRSEGEKSVKRNLMIFVTATQVDANGRKASDLALRK